jgi:hypothetical protein
MLATRLVATLHLRWLPPLIAAVGLSACGGGGGGDSDAPPPPPGTMVTISGKITFDRIPFKTTVGDGLNFASPVESPVRNVVVEALDGSSSTVLATTSTNATGDYSVQVPAARSVRIRAKAQMLSSTAPTMDFRVRNNKNAGALYALDGDAASSGTSNSTRNLRATSGWGGSSYTATRAAAPFAILDTVYRAKELIVTATPTASFPALNLYWSMDNKSTEGVFCTDNGDIGTTFYTGSGNADNCTPGGSIDAGIYVLGYLSAGVGDTDEFDQHVIAHEFGHYIEDQFGRSDSVGGEHGGGQRLDLRVAFGEGWGNAYSGMTLSDPVYRDSAGTNSDGGLNLESDSTLAEGWFSEASAGEIIWDAFDSVADANDTVSLGFAPIFAVMTSAQVSTDAFTSIYSFATSLRAANAAAASGITALLSGESIFGTDEFGSGETNAGTSALSLPVYRTIALSDPTPTVLCTNASFGKSNRLDNRRFLRFTVTNGAFVSFSAAGSTSGGTAATDPDIIVYRDGNDLQLDGEDFKDDEPVEVTAQTQLAAGTYAIEVYDYDLVQGPNTTSCMTVAVTGTGS